MASYANDTAIYGTRDYWASPSEFLKGRTDCEDYAVVKYFTLRIVIAKDRKRGWAHVVLDQGRAMATVLNNSPRTSFCAMTLFLRYG